MSDSIRWLHLSDLHHSSSEDEKYNQSLLYENILKRIRRQVASRWRPHFLFITGDLTNQGEPDGFDRFAEFLVELQSIIGETADGYSVAERTYIVPGNHDIKRQRVSPMLRQGPVRRPDFPRDEIIFQPSDEGRDARRFFVEGVEALKIEILHPYLKWIDTADGTLSEVVRLANGQSVGLGLINTSWLCCGNDDYLHLDPGQALVDAMLDRIEHAPVKIVLGHHPLPWFTAEAEDKISESFSRHKVIYLHGHEHVVSVSHGRGLVWPVEIGAGASWQSPKHTSGFENRIMLSELDFDQLEIKLLIEKCAPGKLDSYEKAVAGTITTLNPSAEFSRHANCIPLPNFDQGVPSIARDYIQSLSRTTRFTRRTFTHSIVNEHVMRSSDADVGDLAFDRSPLTIDEALSTHHHAILIGDSGTGKTFALRKLESTLRRALRTGNHWILWERYPSWEHAPKPLPIWIDAPTFANWLGRQNDGQNRTNEKRAGGGSDNSSILRFYFEQTASQVLRPFQQLPEANIHCRRNGFVLFIDEWVSLTREQSIHVNRAILEHINECVSVRRPVVFYACTRDSSLDIQHPPFSEDRELFDAPCSAADSFDRFTVALFEKSEQMQIVESRFPFIALSRLGDIGLKLLSQSDRKHEEERIRTDEKQRLLSHIKANSHIACTALGLEILIGSQPSAWQDIKWTPAMTFEALLRFWVPAEYYESIEQTKAVLADAYEQSRHTRKLLVRLLEPQLSNLEKSGLFQFVDGDHCSLRNVMLQDILIGKALASSHASFKSALKKLYHPHGNSVPRREPLFYSFFWLLGENLDPTLASGLFAAVLDIPSGEVFAGQEEYRRKVEKGTTILLATIIVELANFWTDRAGLIENLHAKSCEQFATRVKQILDEWDDFKIQPYGRHLLGQSLAVLGFLRPGVGGCVGNQSPVIGPDVTWKAISAGKCFIGSEPDSLEALYADLAVPPDDEAVDPEHPYHEPINFHISKYPITNAQFEAFVMDPVMGYESGWVWDLDSNGLKLNKPVVRKWESEPGQENRPASNLTWDECAAFCRWFTRLAGFTVDMPTAKRWEYVARQGNSDPSMQFTYASKAYLAHCANTQEEGLPGSTAVGLFPQSDTKDGVSDLIGQVFEWCSNLYSDRERDFFETRGGSYNHDWLRSRISTRGKKHRNSQHPYMGFRLTTSEYPGQARNRKRIVIVGGGFSGICTAIRLLRLAHTPLEIVVVERHRSQLYGGLAYAESTTGWEHLLNLQAGRISAFREDRDDFVRWLNCVTEAKRERELGWPDEWHNKTFDRHSAIPRRFYQQYLQERLQEAVNLARTDVAFMVLQGEALAHKRNADSETLVVRLHSEDREMKVDYDHLILASGNLATKTPPDLRSLDGEGYYFEDQYSVEVRSCLKSLPDGGKVLVLGSALRSLDVVMSLKHHEKSNDCYRADVRIYLLSRNKRLHPSYSDSHLHKAVQLPRPSLLDDKNAQWDNEDWIVERVFECYKSALNSDAIKQFDSDLRPERILKAWERWVPEFVARVPKQVLAKLRAKYQSLVTVLRIGVVPEIGKILEKEAASVKNLDYQPSTLRVRKHAHNAHISWTDSKGRKWEETFDLIINCAGRERDYTSQAIRENIPLWKDLLGSGIAQPHSGTDIGVEIDDEGALISNVDGTPTPNDRVSCVGVMREGHELSRNGRLGSFSFTLGPIKNQALQTAYYVLRRLQADNVTKAAAESYRRKFRIELERLPPDESEWVNAVLSFCVNLAFESVHIPVNPTRAASLANEICNAVATKVGHRAGALIDLALLTVDHIPFRRRLSELFDNIACLTEFDAALKDRLANEVSWRVEEGMLLHLTRLDVVEPRELFLPGE